ncbi:MAG: TolC family protein [Bacteroidia bacterium]|nr:TolC family protein [Bacteroidia bacterium]
MPTIENQASGPIAWTRRIVGTTFALCSAIGLRCAAQAPVFTAADVAAAALEYNHDVLIARKALEIAENNSKPGNAGWFPTLSLNANVNYGNNNTRLRFAGNLPPVENPGAQNVVAATNATLNYVVFDGLQTLFAFRRLEAVEERTEVEYRLAVENTLLQTLLAYHEVLRAEIQLRIGRAAMELSAERLLRAKARFESGNAPRSEILGAQVDLNADSAAFANARLTLDNAKRALNRCAGGRLGENFSLDTSLKLMDEIALEPILNAAMENNVNIVLAQKRCREAEWEVKVAQSALYPRLDLTAQYGLTQQNNDAGILLESRTFGFSGALSFRFNVFDGGRARIRIQNAETTLKSLDLAREKARLTVEEQTRNAYALYQTRRYLLNLETRNAEVARENHERLGEQFKQGTATGIQYREAQIQWIRAQAARENARIALKISEIELAALAGTLLSPQ